MASAWRASERPPWARERRPRSSGNGTGGPAAAMRAHGCSGGGEWRRCAAMQSRFAPHSRAAASRQLRGTCARVRRRRRLLSVRSRVKSCSPPVEMIACSILVRACRSSARESVLRRADTRPSSASVAVEDDEALRAVASARPTKASITLIRPSSIDPWKLSCCIVRVCGWKFSAMMSSFWCTTKNVRTSSMKINQNR